MYEQFQQKQPVQIAEKYFDMCFELASRKLDPDENINLSQFTKMFITSGSTYIQEFKKNAFVQRHVPLVEKILEFGTGTKILDAGCGLGYDSIFYALLDAEVVGVDLSKNRLAVASYLKKIFEKEYPRLNVEFHYRDIFTFLEDNRDRFAKFFDVIWLTEAISHIHPMEKFFEMIKQYLSPRGLLAISEGNMLNPINYLRNKQGISKASKSRGGALEKKADDYYLHLKDYKDPVSGKEVLVADERAMTPIQMKRKLELFGYEVQKCHFRTYLPSLAVKYAGIKTVRAAEAILQRLPIIKYAATRYIIYATPKN
ncbi:MAG: class I SAM-dependent methyltransferase [bacterium]